MSTWLTLLSRCVHAFTKCEELLYFDFARGPSLFSNTFAISQSPSWRIISALRAIVSLVNARHDPHTPSVGE